MKATAKENGYGAIVEKHNKKLLFAFVIAIFGILLFIAFALTLPWNG